MEDKREKIVNAKVQEIIDEYDLVREEGMYAWADPDEFINRQIEECMESYIDNEINYVVDKATLTCSLSSDKQVTIIQRKKETEIKGECGGIKISKRNKVRNEIEEIYEAHIENEEVRKLFATSSSKNDCNGLQYATVVDTKSKYAIEQGEKEGEANIISFGNCKVFLEEDLDKIIDSKEKVKKYGLCYCLMDLADKWINPMCVNQCLEDTYDMELPSYNSLTRYSVSNLYSDKLGISGYSSTNHAKTMEWAVQGGKEEGLTMLSTLLCNRGGIISVEFSGQTLLLELSDLLDLTEEDILLMGEKEFLDYIQSLNDIEKEFKITGELKEVINDRLKYIDKVKGIVIYVTDKTFADMGWSKNDYENTFGKDFIEQMRKCMFRDGITNVNSIAMFLSNIGAETGDGTEILEKGDETYFNKHGYTTNTRGFGIIQVSVENQELFVKYLLNNEKDQNKLKDLEDYLKGYTTKKGLYSNDVIINGKSASEYLGENYPIESGTWFWGVRETFGQQGPDVKTINDYITVNDKNLDEDELFDKSIGFTNTAHSGEKERKEDWEVMKGIINP